MGYRIGEFSIISGVSASNIRYYEQRGFPIAGRTESGYRQYQFEDSYRINTFNALLAHGFSVSEAVELLNPHPADELARRLLIKNAEIEGQIQMLQKKLEWNHIVQNVLQNGEQELKMLHEVSIPDLCYFKCTEGYDHSPSLKSGDLMSKWVDCLPLSHYAAQVWQDGRFTLGMIMELSDAQKYHVNDPITQVIPAGEYYALLLNGEDAEKEEKEDPRILSLVQDGFKLPEYSLHIYLMVLTEEYGNDLNYLLLKKGNNY